MTIHVPRLRPMPSDDLILPANSHPSLVGLYDFWRSLCGGRVAPARADFDVADLRPWLGNLMILDIEPDGDFRYRLYGTGLVHIFGFDLSRRQVSETSHLIGDKPLAEYRQVRDYCQPVYAARFSPSAREYLAVDKLALPLVEAGAVNKILGAIYPSQDRSGL